jgi:Ca-activated chloride channel family protein
MSSDRPLENFMRKRLPLLLFLCLLGKLCSLASPAFAVTPITPPLMQTIGAEQPVALQDLHIAAEISGGIAQTTVRMVFRNPNARPLEGTLQFPLTPRQQIVGFSLDINHSLRAAVPVEKEKGRKVFEDVERRGVDPALLENTQGNNFKLRVYPIPAGGTREVEVRYSEVLLRDDGAWTWRLPLAYGNPTGAFDLAVNVQGASAAPKVLDAMAAIAFTQHGTVWQADIKREQLSATTALTLQIAAADAPKSYAQSFNGEHYFVVELPVSTERIARPLPTIVGLLWDSSSSAANAQRANLAELDAYFKRVANVEVRLTRLRDRASAPIHYKVANGNWDTLRGILEATDYDGASALADWVPDTDVDDYLLFSDGLRNYGKSVFPTLGARQRLYALNATLAADTSVLAAWAERNHGTLFQIDANRPGASVTQLLNDGARVSDLHGSGVSDLLVDASDSELGTIRILGKLTMPKAQISLSLSDNGAGKTLTLPLSVDAPIHPLAAYLWASRKLRTLEADGDLKRAEIRRLGMAFGIPTRETSLIVLDSLQDYYRYEITPPPELLDAYRDVIRMHDSQFARSREHHLESVVRQFNSKIAWWEKSYPKDKGTDSIPAGQPRTGDQTIDHARADVAQRREVAAASRNSDIHWKMAAPAPMAMASAPPPDATVGSATSADTAKTGPQTAIGISLKPWRSNAPYLARLNQADADKVYAIYLDEKPSYANSVGFYLDAADILFAKKQNDLALRVLSNLAEMDLEERNVLRILGYRLMQAGQPELAIQIFTRVQAIAQEEPQSFRDLGLAYAAAGKNQLAIDQLNQVIVRPWDDRFAEIELITLTELNAIVAANAGQSSKLDTSAIDSRLLKNMPLDLRVVLSWDADNSDMDLWVTDPNGERCYYGNRFTRQGGRLSRDFTGGYGPEEFSLRDAKPGKYKIEANFFGSRQQAAASATTLQAKVTSGFGTRNAKDLAVTLRLSGRGETVFVGEFEVKAR